MKHSGIFVLTVLAVLCSTPSCVFKHAKDTNEAEQAGKGQLCGGYTEQRELSEEDAALFGKVAGGSVFSPLSVATQVVAGLNYRFYCRYDSGTACSPSHCFVTIYQPLQGEPVLTAVLDEDCGPVMKVIVGNDGTVGRYLDENEGSYHGEIQDEYWVEKDKAQIETVRACDGRGIITLKNPGKETAFRLPQTDAEAAGTLVHESGYVPEVYRCLGCIKGWFLADVNGQAGFIQEDLVIWDAIDSF